MERLLEKIKGADHARPKPDMPHGFSRRSSRIFICTIKANVFTLGSIKEWSWLRQCLENDSQMII